MIVVLAVTVLAGPPPLAAQGADAQGDVSFESCTFESCALRVQTGLFSGASIIRGVSGEKVQGVGFFVGSVDETFAGVPAAQELAATFRSRQNTGAVFLLLGGVALLGGTLSSADGFVSDGEAMLIVGGSLGLLIGGLIAASGRDPLDRAVFEYNRALAARR